MLEKVAFEDPILSGMQMDQHGRYCRLYSTMNFMGMRIDFYNFGVNGKR